MNMRKIAFIICSNDDLYLNEAIVYLKRLIVPEEYEVELLVIKEAKSMLEGMQEGRESTDAKYKVYMHHDVFIINRNFISDLLSVFESDENIGLVGMVGYKKMGSDGVMWFEKYEGAIYVSGIGMPDYTAYSYDISHGLIDVVSVDGLLMATAYDIPLRTDLFEGWDFYDVSTSLEYKRAGYRVVVPMQKCPWVLHDDGKYLSLWDYDRNRHIAMKEYSDFIFEEEGIKHYDK